jgi:hypothetical protein
MIKKKMNGASRNHQAWNLINVSCDASVSLCEIQSVDQVIQNHFTCEDEGKKKKKKSKMKNRNKKRKKKKEEEEEEEKEEE